MNAPVQISTRWQIMQLQLILTPFSTKTLILMLYMHAAKHTSPNFENNTNIFKIYCNIFFCYLCLLTIWPLTFLTVQFAKLQSNIALHQLQMVRMQYFRTLLQVSFKYNFKEAPNVLPYVISPYYNEKTRLQAHILL